MHSDLDPVRSAALPDSFERTAAWLRAAPPPRPMRTAAAGLVAALVLLAAAAWPVDSTVAAGSVIEVLSADSVEAQRSVLAALDRLVPDDRRQIIDIEEEAGTVLRVAVVGTDRAEADRWRAALVALPGTRAARVLRLDVSERRPLGVWTARRVLGTEPRLSDAALQAELDAVFARAEPLRVRRTADGRRMIDIGDRVTLQAPDDTRVAPLDAPGTAVSGLVIEGAPPGGARLDERRIHSLRALEPDSLGGIPTERRTVSRITVRRGDAQTRLDSLSPHLARQVHEALRLRADTLRFVISRADTLAWPDSLAPSSGARIDTVRRVLLFHSLRDSL